MTHHIFTFYKHRCGASPDTEREHGLARDAIERFCLWQFRWQELTALVGVAVGIVGGWNGEYRMKLNLSQGKDSESDATGGREGSMCSV